ncbi:MAG: hypothetical protein ABSF47_02435 [Minisyncoccia bacterium]
MNPETKTCQNCKQPFRIEPDDFAFYEQIKVPPPTFCFDCRLERRMVWRNERSLYRRKCNAPGHSEDIISMYAPEGEYNVVDSKFWWSDGWDPMMYGLYYNFSVPFFKQFERLTHSVPLLNLSIVNSNNSDYTNYVDGNKDCYLVFGSGWNENVNYGNKIMGNKDSQDLLGTTKCELSYESVNCVECYRLLYSRNCKACSNSWFLYNCRNCQDCVGCANQNNKTHCIFNVQYSKEEYEKKLGELGLNTVGGIASVKEEFTKTYLQVPHRYANIFNSVDCTGENINDSKNVKYSFDIFEKMEDSRYMYGSLQTKDCYDGNGIYQNPMCYETVDANIGQNVHMSLTIYSSNDITYCWNCHSSSDLFGCVGLRNKKYCILNKQYTKEEYDELLPKIKKHMNDMPYVDKIGRKYGYGEYFPDEISPFAHNESISQEYFTLSKEETEKAGYAWRNMLERDYRPTLRSDQLPDSSSFPESIANEVVECEHKGSCNEQCTTAFKFIPAEIQFYKRLNLPLPHFCPNCRHYARLRQRNPIKLWHRKCQCVGEASENGVYQNTVQHQHGAGKCPNEFETSYSPERKEIVYCEQCYQAEVV